MRNKTILSLGAFLMALGVGLGAFGAHGLNPLLVANGRIDSFNTAVQYHFLHAMGLLILGLIPIKSKTSIAIWMLAGIFFFCGALYVLSITNITIIGAVAPVGGSSFMIAWLLLAYRIYRSPSD